MASPTKAAVSGSLLVGLGNGINQTQMNDITQSLLFAQLAASKRYDPATSPQDWFSMYTKTLETVGWIMQAFQFVDVENIQRFSSADQVVKHILQSDDALTDQDRDIADQAVTALKKAGLDSDAQRVLDKHSIFADGTGKVIMQIAIATDSNGNLLLKLFVITYTLPSGLGSPAPHALWTTWSSTAGVEFSFAVQTMQLNESVYGVVRETIAKSLAGFMSQIVNLD